MTIIQRSLLLWPCSLWTATIQGQITTYTVHATRVTSASSDSTTFTRLQYKSRPDLNPVALLVTQPPSEPYTSGYYLTCATRYSGLALTAANGPALNARIGAQLERA